MPRWLILADDLTGAADCAVAFARRGHAAAVTWAENGGEADEAVLAIDADSRRLIARDAADRHAALLRPRLRPGLALYKKIDSTLRGQPAAELAATLTTLEECRPPALAVVAPAFPDTGRTTEGGRIRLNGAPLEDSPLWAREHSYANADLYAVLEGVGLPTALLPLAALRGGPEAVAAAMRHALSARCRALVCDSATTSDLETIARARGLLEFEPVWVGSGGLAAALASAEQPGQDPPLPRLPAARGGLLLVVGSLAEASRAAADHALAQGGLRHFGIPPALLHAGPVGWNVMAREIAAAIAAREDVLAMIEAEPGADLRQGAPLALALAELLQPAASQAGGLFATGGETARALLSRLGVQSIRLLEEVAPGVPFGLTRGARRLPVVTKAGGFGDTEIIRHVRHRLHAWLQEETAA
ncbi:four-carbon acid sugar kinase family protein [Pseudoroseomonas wenyumeiae]|uniref:Four-carbon acid sugar kinase family protein n=2 Tax=Teichococcus wenyumeiae TaxID=2478470 RepID=A0A3A9JEH4_9PROT|nr:four-carbon acid sugar kinase family protein [Pseudoroseomonas wenyumeiae]RMI20458.1 four-carbon acid sugar kinase family protein [Pseudoroseomonas wenyumeiae]